MKQKASEVDELKKDLDALRSSLNQVEAENSSYKTRIDNLQNNVDGLVTAVRELDALYHVSMNKLLDGDRLNMLLDKIPFEDEIKKYLEEKYGESE